MTDKEERDLRELLLNSKELKELDEWPDDFDLFDVLKITNMEIRHSNMLAWLLDPNGNHGMGDAFIKEFVARVAYNIGERKYDIFKLLLQDFSTYQVYREKNNMDIVLISQEEQTVYIIENKIWSSEQKNQLKTYLEISKTEYADYTQKIYVFLTPEGYDSSDPENWISISYEDIIQALEDAICNKTLNPEVNLLVNSYIRNIRKNVMKEKDEKLLTLCNEIYNKHRHALKLIYENVSIDQSWEAEIVRDTLKKFNDEGKIIFDNNNRWRFLTPTMEAFLPHVEDDKSSWNTDSIYYYWMETIGEKLVMHCELGLMNLTKEAQDKVNTLIEASGKKGNSNKFKRIYYKSVDLSKISADDKYGEKFEKYVETLVNSALKVEEEWFVKIKEIQEKTNHIGNESDVEA